MGKFRTHVGRSIAAVLMLAFAVVSSTDCIVAAEMTPEQRACCATMHGDCGETAVSMSCCPAETSKTPGLVVAKVTVAFAPIAALLAVLTPPTPPLVPSSHFFGTIAESSSGPPGVPTYLFVSSFRL